MTDKINLCGLSRPEMERLVTESGHKSFRGRQLYKWIYKNRIFDFQQMTDLKKELRTHFADRYFVGLPSPAARQKSSDGTEKFLFEFDDGNVAETVLIPDEESGRMTLCLSSQSGCALGCRFCATGYLGFRRNLMAGEIVGQALAVRSEYGDEAFDNVVFMGMGEPLLNFEAVMAAIHILTDSVGLAVAARRITLSTIGVVPGIRKLIESGSKVNLAVSLNAPDDALRRKLMPAVKSYPLAQLMAAVKAWTVARKRRVTFEYILFKNVNDSHQHALELAALVKGIPCKINLLAYNPVNSAHFARPEDDEVDRFAQTLYPRAPAVTVRKSRGRDIAAACGQLAGKKGY